MSDVQELVDHLFRHRAGAMVSTLTRILGPSNLDLAEDVVQEALLKALRQWPFSGVPENPSAWLVQVAKNQAIDVLRRGSSFRDKEPEIEKWLNQVHGKEHGSGPGFENELADDQLKMMFACCHPVILPEGRLALTLKTVGGFGVSEIARAFLSEKPTVAQRIVRAKRKLREEDVPFGIPAPEDIPERLDSVLKVLYLMFNEGYSAHQGENLIRYDLVGEAMRLCSLVASRPATKLPKVRALLALMLLQAARLPGRVDPPGWFSTAPVRPGSRPVGSWQSIGDDHVSVGLGIVIYDGDGRTTRRVTVNAPDGIGGRRLIVFNSVGWYAVNADGTGTATYDNDISTGSMTRTTFDFVVTEVQGISLRRRGAKLAQAIYSVQREPGVTVSLVTNVQTRQSDLDNQ